MISKRLAEIVSVIDGQCLADIGCDHAYIACQAVHDNRVSKAYACDIGSKPLENARQSIEEFSLQDKISCLLMDGLQGLPDDVDVVVIAGMGGKMIEQILQEGNPGRKIRYILSPHRNTESLRYYLQEHHFLVKYEKIVYDRHYYPIIVCDYDAEQREDYTELEMITGKNPVMDTDYRSYIHDEIKKYTNLLNKVGEPQRNDIIKRIEYLKKRDMS